MNTVRIHSSGRSLVRSLLRRGLLLLVVGLAVGTTGVQAQMKPTERQIRTYVPPDQLVSFLPSTPFDQFIQVMNPIFERVMGKQIVDAEARTSPIDVSISGMYFRDALEVVLQQNGLVYKESDKHFVLLPAPEEQGVFVEAGGGGSTKTAKEGVPDVSADTREIQIDALLFEVNLNKARELGMDWSMIFGEGSSSGSSGGGSGGNSEEKPKFYLKTGSVFEGVSDALVAPDVVDVSVLTRLLRVFESNGVGEAVANPQARVQSGEVGRMQVGTDIPIQIRDFSGNTITEFVRTGIIITVKPTLFLDAPADTAQAEELEFVHLNVTVEKSSGRPTAAGVIVDRNQADTQVLLLDGEQTIIGGLYSTEEQLSRRGIPILKDLPGWLFGLRYVFGFEQKTIVQKELLIVLQARVVDPLHIRARRPLPSDLRVGSRDQVRERLEQFGIDPDEVRLPLQNR